jgi:hypothetical protein
VYTHRTTVTSENGILMMIYSCLNKLLKIEGNAPESRRRATVDALVEVLKKRGYNMGERPMVEIRNLFGNSGKTPYKVFGYFIYTQLYDTKWDDSSFAGDNHSRLVSQMIRTKGIFPPWEKLPMPIPYESPNLVMRVGEVFMILDQLKIRQKLGLSPTPPQELGLNKSLLYLASLSVEDLQSVFSPSSGKNGKVHPVSNDELSGVVPVDVPLRESKDKTENSPGTPKPEETYVLGPPPDGEDPGYELKAGGAETSSGVSVYFIRSTSNYPRCRCDAPHDDDCPALLVKIGFTSRDPELRCKELRTGNPDLFVFRTVPTTKNQKLERFLHSCFASKQYKQEWYYLADREIKSLADFLA